MIIIHTPAHLTATTVQPGFPAASLSALAHGTAAAIMADVVFTAVLAGASLVADVASSDADRLAVASAVATASRVEAAPAVAVASAAATASRVGGSSHGGGGFRGGKQLPGWGGSSRGGGGFRGGNSFQGGGSSRGGGGFRGGNSFQGGGSSRGGGATSNSVAVAPRWWKQVSSVAE